MKFRSRTPKERRILQQQRKEHRNRWSLTFTWVPRRLCDEYGDPTQEVAWLEWVATIARDLDYAEPYLFGPPHFAVSQPKHHENANRRLQEQRQQVAQLFGGLAAQQAFQQGLPMQITQTQAQGLQVWQNGANTVSP